KPQTPLAESTSNTKLATATNGGESGGFFKLGRPKLRVTSWYVNENSSTFSHKVSSKLLDNLAKLKLRFKNNRKGEVSEPQVSFTSKYFRCFTMSRTATLVKAQFEIMPGIQLNAGHQFKVLFKNAALISNAIFFFFSIQRFSV
ncbi:outer envelope pore protein 37 chloroplastic, partial [Phtheirospermum japonicum]